MHHSGIYLPKESLNVQHDLHSRNSVESERSDYFVFRMRSTFVVISIYAVQLGSMFEGEVFSSE